MSYQDVLKNLNIEKVLGPAKRYNLLVVDNAEKLMSMHLDSVRSYTDLGIKQMRDALEVNDAKTLQDYLGNQAEVVRTVAERAQQDMKALAELGQSFGNDLQKLLQENAASAAGNAENAKSKAPASTTSTSSGTARKSA